MSGIRRPAVAGQFYPTDPAELQTLVAGFLGDAAAEPVPAVAVIVPHAGLVYSGRCAAHVFARVRLPDVVVLVGPNHRGHRAHPFGASLWTTGAFETPLGRVPIADGLAARIEAASPLVGDDRTAHLPEHALEVELPFLQTLSPETRVVPLLLAWDDWPRCRELAETLAAVITDSDDEVLLAASSDMTHYEPAAAAAAKDRMALSAIERLDGEALLEICRREHVTMCGRAPAAVVLETARRLGAKRAEIVDYRHSGLVTGDDERVVAYAGVVIR